MDYLIQINRHTLLEFGPVVDQELFLKAIIIAKSNSLIQIPRGDILIFINFSREIGSFTH